MFFTAITPRMLAANMCIQYDICSYKIHVLMSIASPPRSMLQCPPLRFLDGTVNPDDNFAVRDILAAVLERRSDQIPQPKATGNFHVHDGDTPYGGILE